MKELFFTVLFGIVSILYYVYDTNIYDLESVSKLIDGKSEWLNDIDINHISGKKHDINKEFIEEGYTLKIKGYNLK